MTERIDHDVLKRALLQTLREYAETFEQSGTDVVVHEEKPVTVDGRRRHVDVMVTKENEYSVEPSAKYAFEVKTTLSDTVGVASQLADYAAADCHPILVAADYLFDENGVIREEAGAYGLVVGVTAFETGEFSFDTLDGGFGKIGLHDLPNHWDGLVDYANSKPEGDPTEEPSNVSLPWIYRRESAVADREVTKQLHLQKETARQLVDFESEIESQLGEDVYRADLKEAAVLAAMQSPDLVVEQLERWGYNPDN